MRVPLGTFVAPDARFVAWAHGYCWATADITAETCVQAFCNHWVAQFAVPGILTTDNSGTLCSFKEFQQFSKEWNFQSILVSPHHQQTNGLAECTIQTIKELLKKCNDHTGDIYLASLALRNTLIYHSYTPSQILMSRYLRDNLALGNKSLDPKIINKYKFKNIIDDSQFNTKQYYD
ncbi:hypothetical protein ILUMI_07525 [Ignelater luminosus]|uniref:Integrase catalytic domain-containing protein n=1 Tax=Ignelater luminosus TaxID=2038154 RepID=A0A8K0D6B2_IGNLU|nr:hypothetical protein ILUMI_07525 [Ignelater luminosus]